MSQPAVANQGPIQAGEVLDGKYRIERVLGKSGMGIVFLANHVELDQLVAIKFLLEESVLKEDVLARFKREAKVLGKVRSNHVVRVMDVGNLGHAPYIVMEYLEGDDLLRTLRRDGRMQIERACWYVMQAAEGLAAAHAAGIVHRDLKPSNVFVVPTADGSEIVKIIDFGVAKLHDGGAESHELTQTNMLVGSPRYMSPEQVTASKTIDQRTDIWSLAVILQELLTGMPLFKADAMSKLFVMILTEQPASLAAQLPGAPPELTKALDLALQKEPEARTPNMLAFARSIAPFAGPGAHAAVARISNLLERSRVSGVNSSASLPSMPNPPSSPLVDSTPSAASSVRRQVSSTGGEKQSGASWVQAGAAVNVVVADEPKRTSRTPLIVAIAALVVGLAVGVFVYQRSRPTIAEVPRGAQATATPSAPAASAQTAAPPSTTTAAPPDTSQAVTTTTSATAGAAVKPMGGNKPIVGAKPTVGAPKPTATTTAAAPATAAPVATPAGGLFDDPR